MHADLLILMATDPLQPRSAVTRNSSTYDAASCGSKIHRGEMRASGSCACGPGAFAIGWVSFCCCLLLSRWWCAPRDQRAAATANPVIPTEMTLHPLVAGRQ